MPTHSTPPVRISGRTAVAALCVVVGAACVARAHAHAGAALLSAGDGADTWLDGAARFVVNGVEFSAHSGRSASGVDTVLSRLALACEALSASDWHAAIDAPEPSVKARRSRTVLQYRSGDAGFVACLHAAEGLSLDSLVEWAGGIAAGAPLTTPLPVRYARVEGNAHGARYLLLSTPAPIDLTRALPAEGDAPHAPLEFDPPPGSRLLLAARAAGAEDRAPAPEFLVFHLAEDAAPGESMDHVARQLGGTRRRVDLGNQEGTALLVDPGGRHPWLLTRGQDDEASYLAVARFGH